MKTFLLACTLFACNLVNAQAGGYLFSQQLGTYTPVNGTVVLSNCTNNNQYTDTSSLVTLPQPFTFCGTAYNQIRAGKNGWITFGSINPLNANNDFYRTALSNTEGTPGVVQALYTGWQIPQNGATPCDANVQTALDGNEFVIQWTNGQYSRSVLGFGSITFWQIDVQIRLNFSDNSIKIIYGRFELAGCSPPGFATVCQGELMNAGIVSNGSDYLVHRNARYVPKGATLTELNPIPFTESIRGSGCTVHDTRSIPAGTTFTWLPGSLFPPSTYSVSSIESTTAILKWNKITTADGYEYNVRKATGNFNANWPETGTIVTDSFVNITGLQPDTVYQLAVRSRKGNHLSEWRYFEHTFSTPCNTVSLPYTADFTDAPCMKVIRDSATQIGWGGGNLVNEFDHAATPVGSWMFSRRLTLNAGTTYRIYFEYSGNSYGSRTLDNNLKVQMSRGYNDTLNLVPSPLLNVPLLYTDNGVTGLDTFMLFTPSVTGNYTVAFFARASAALGLVQVRKLEIFDNALMNTIPCPALLSPINNSVQTLFSNLVLTWQSLPKASKYYYYVSDSAYYGNLTTFDEYPTFDSFSYGQYTGEPGNRNDWYVIPRIYGSRLEGCSTNVRTYRTENAAAPPNDFCSNAITLPVSDGFCSRIQRGSLIKATFSNSSDTAGNCMPAHANPDDVWYKIIIPATGNAVIQLSRYNNNTATNMSMMAFTGSCGNVTRIACAFNNRFAPPIDSLSYICRMPISGRTPGETIYIRVSTASLNSFFGLLTDSKSYFSIGAFDNTASVMPAIAGNANQCNNMQPTVIDSASGNLYMWVPLLTANGDIIGEVHPSGSEMGTVTGGAYVNNGALRSNNGVTYLDRNFTISPSSLKLKNNFSRVYVRLYAKQNEVNAYNTAAGDAGIRNFKINKNNDNCSSAFISIGNAELAVADSGRYSNDYVFGTGTTSFSSFYLYKGSPGLPLPLRLISFTGAKKNNAVELKWLTANEVNTDHFEIEKSNDGRLFHSFASVVPNINNNYSATDETPAAGINFYRLKMIDNDGRFTYSYVVKVDATKKYSIQVIPNPAHDFIQLIGANSSTQIQLVDATGKTVRRFTNTADGIFNVSGLSKGMYLLQMINAKEIETQKIIIE